jgi:hypothetical protein
MKFMRLETSNNLTVMIRAAAKAAVMTMMLNNQPRTYNGNKRIKQPVTRSSYGGRYRAEGCMALG